MPDLLGFISIVLVSFLTFIMALRWRKVSAILLVALVVRILFLYINNYFFYLPDGNMDALVFESLAWEWSRDGFFNTFNFYFGPSAHFLSFLIAIPYSLLGRSLLMAQSFSIIFGIASVFIMQSYGVAWTWFILISTIINIMISLTLLRLFPHD